MKQRNRKESEQAKHSSRPFFGQTAVFPKLTVNAPNDKYEQEADAMADQVMRMSQTEEEMIQDKPLSDSIQRVSDAGFEEEMQLMPLRRQCSACEEEAQRMPLMRQADGGGYEAPANLSTQLQSSKGGGSPLPDASLQRMSSAFGTDFNGVRVHTGSRAEGMNQSIQAKAFTHGSDIYFNKGAYQPGSSGGDRLLAHELTHVVQQKSDGRGTVQRFLGGIGLPTGIRFLDKKKEKPILSKVYGSSLNYSEILLTNGSGTSARPFTIYTVLPIIGSVVILNVGKSAYNSPGSDPNMLIHEAAHAWQSQHHPDRTAFMVNSVLSQGLAKVNGESAYCYKPGKFFGYYAAEQIAQQIENGEASIRAHAKAFPPMIPDPANILSLSIPRTEKKGTKGVKC